MKVVVDLTDEQADLWAQDYAEFIEPLDHYASEHHRVWRGAAKALAVAIVAARPKPLKVGDKVTTLGSALTKEVVAIGVDPCNGRRWMVVADDGSSSPFLWIDFQAVRMADGSPIAWPTEGSS